MTNIKPRDFKIGDFTFGVLDNAVQISTKDNWVFLDHYNLNKTIILLIEMKAYIDGQRREK